MKKKKVKKRYVWSAVFLLAFLSVFSWRHYQENIVRAAEGETGGIIVGEDKGAGTYSLRNKNIPAYIEGILTGSKVKWSTSDTTVFRINSQEQATIEGGAQVTLNAVGTGVAILTAEYTGTDGKTVTATRNISVPSAINQDAKYFDLVHSDQNESAMILEKNQEGTLELLFKVPVNSSINWASINNDVVVIETQADGTGKFKTTGTGKTKITVSYTESGELKSSSVDVYVGPDVTFGDQPITDKKLNVKKGDPISMGGNTNNKNETINDKVYWVLTDQNQKVVENSLTGNKKYFETEPYSSNLTVSGKAGLYYLYVFTAGAYQETDNITTNTIHQNLKKTVTLRILPQPFNNTGEPISLQVGDSYNVAEMYNMTVEDFNTYFDYRCEPATRGDFSSGEFTANETGSVELTVNLKDGKRADFIEFLQNDTNMPPYKIICNIYRGFALDRSEASIYVGGTLKLGTVYGANKGTITWKSEDKNYVTVEGKDTSAIITGIKSTGDKSVKVTASMKLDDGRTLTASCSVKVGTTATKITLSETDLTLRTNATATITAKYQPATTTSVKLQWLLTDDSVVDLSVNSEKSVVVTGKKPGTTILTAVNTDNYIMAYCTIRVSSAIESITLNHTELNMTMSQEMVRLRATYTPTDATLAKLKWSTSDPKIATVDDGLVTFVGPGTVLITVQPEWNENFVMAQCKLTIQSSPTAFALDKTSLTMEAGQKEKLTPKLTAANSTTKITWSTMDSKIATVNDGTVTAVAPGVTHIIATTAEGLIASCQVVVTQKASGIALSEYNIRLAVGETKKVTATANPSSSTEKTFTWTSKDPKIATVNAGTVTGVSSGSTVILVKTKSGEVTYLYVSVYDKATGMSLNYANKQLAKGSSFTLKPIFVPANATNLNVTWKSLNTDIATVNNGKVKGVKGGSAVITCTAEDGGYLATCLVTVVEPVATIKLNYSSLKLGLGKSKTLKATVTSNASSNPKLKWSTSNSKIVSVNSSGKIKGKKLGSATITAKTTDGTSKKATCKVKVVRPVTSISLNKSVLTVMVNDTATLKAKVSPSNATYRTVTWSTTNKEVAIVDSKGRVTGLSVGTCNIKATAKDGTKKSVSCHVNVIDPIPTSSIMISAKNLVMIKGQSQMLSYTITPSNHTDKVKFASDNKSVATVSGTGKVYARRTGSATITLTSGSGKQATVSVTVIGLNKTSITLEQYDTETLFVDGAATGVTWYSQDPSIASVAGGKVVARKAGTTTIYARVSGVLLSCSVTVRAIS